MKKVALQEVRDELPKHLRLAEDEDVVIEEYQLENDLRFLQRIAESREGFREGRFTRLEDIDIKD